MLILADLHVMSSDFSDAKGKVKKTLSDLRKKYYLLKLSENKDDLRLLTHVKVSVRCLFKERPIQYFSVIITFSTFFVFIFKAINIPRACN